MDPTDPRTSRVGLPVSAKFAADLAGRLLQFGLFIVAARTLAPADFGGYAFALAVGSVLGALADAGLQLTLLRDLSGTSERQTASRSLGTALVGRSLVAAPAGLVGVALGLAVDGPIERRAAVIVIVLSQILTSYADIFVQVLRSVGRLQLEAAVTLAARGVLVVAGSFVLLWGGGLVALAAVYAAIGLGWPALMAIVASRFVRPIRPDGLLPVITALRRALPIGVGIGVSLLMFRVDVPLLEWLRGPETVGLYSTAYRIFETAGLLSTAVMAGVFPNLVRAAPHPWIFGWQVRRWALLLAVMGLAATALGWILGPPVIRIAFGERYADAGPLLRILVLAIPPMFVSALLSQALIALGRPWRSTAAFGVALAVNVAVNLALIPSLGATGAAWATAAAETALVVGLSAGLLRRKVSG